MQNTNSWLDLQTSFYKTHLEKVGEPATFRQILFSRFAGYLQTIIQLKKLDCNNSGYEIKKRELKNLLACFSLNLLVQRTKVLSYSGLLQLDFDNIINYDIEEIKQAIFALPFIAFTGISCSGKGLYAFAKIQEPQRLKEYASHIFEIFKFYHIPVDTSKGRNYNDLRYVSYDANMIYREDPQPLKIKRFYQQPKPLNSLKKYSGDNSKLINWAVKQVADAMPGQRFEAVRKAAYTSGGYGTGLNEIKKTILQSNQYAGVERKYLTHADEAYKAGSLKPILT